MTFGEKVRAARKERGLSQKELAARTHIAVRTINIDLASLMDENAEFTIQASEKYGSRGRRQAEKLVKDVEALYAGGELEERDMDAMMRALQDAYWKAKEINRKFVPKKYRDGEET